MFKDVLRHMEAAMFAEIALVIFIAVFIGVLLWTLCRTRAEVRCWAAMPNEEPGRVDASPEEPAAVETLS